MADYLDTIEIAGIDDNFGQNMDVEDVEAPNVLLVTLLEDGSGTMFIYEEPMRECLDHLKSSIKNSKQADEIMLCNVVFNGEIHVSGFVKPEDMDTTYNAGGHTRLYDSIVEMRKRTLDYMRELKDNGTNSRATIVILSDGQDNGSVCTLSDARKACDDLQIANEVLVAFIAFGEDAHGIAKDLGIKNLIDVTNDESMLRKVLDFVSKSAISLSKKASSGAAIADENFFDNF